MFLDEVMTAPAEHGDGDAALRLPAPQMLVTCRWIHAEHEGWWQYDMRLQ